MFGFVSREVGSYFSRKSRLMSIDFFPTPIRVPQNVHRYILYYYSVNIFQCTFFFSIFRVHIQQTVPGHFPYTLRKRMSYLFPLKRTLYINLSWDSNFSTFYYSILILVTNITCYDWSWCRYKSFFTIRLLSY